MFSKMQTVAPFDGDDDMDDDIDNTLWNQMAWHGAWLRPSPGRHLVLDNIDVRATVWWQPQYCLLS